LKLLKKIKRAFKTKPKPVQMAVAPAAKVQSLPRSPMPADMAGVDMTELYKRFPALETVERTVHHRLDNRRQIVSLFKKHAVGAEIGVFTGVFSEYVMRIATPQKYYMVDPWHSIYGDHFPAWGPYTAHGKLPTLAALEAAKLRAKQCGNGEVVVDQSIPWLQSVPDGHLDWIYLDSSHQYQPTLDELDAMVTKLKPDGEVFGDDGWTVRDHPHYGVFRAITQFCRQNRDWEMFRLDHGGQWGIRRAL
jgi:hypothetical protein